MAKVECKPVFITSTGSKIIVFDDFTLAPDRVVLFVANSNTEVSAGYSDFSMNFTGSARYQDENSTYTLTHYRNIGGTKTKVFEATATGASAGELYINVTTRTENTTLYYVVQED